MLRCLAALAVLLAVAPAAAQDADATIEEGLALREQGRDAEALERFRAAYESAPSARALAQIALAEQALGRFVDAEAHLVEAMELGGEWIERNREALEGARSVLEAHLASLELTGGPAGAEVHVDGRSRGELPLDSPLRVPAGTLEVEIRADDHYPMRRTVEVRGGGLARLEVVLRAREPDDEPSRREGPARITPEIAEAPSDPAPAIVSLTIGGVALAGVVGSVLLWLDRARITSDCEAMPLCTSGAALRLERDGAAALTIGLAVTGTGLLITGIVLLADPP